MARIRTIKPDFFTDEKLNQVSIEARLLFVGLLVFSDDMGRQQYSPRRLKSQIFPDDKFVEEAVDRWVEELAEIELIKLYTSGRQRHLWIPGFLRHQKINHPGHSSLPPHPKDLRPDCRCPKCKAQRNGGESVPEGTTGFSESRIPVLQDSRIHPLSRKWEVGEEQNQHQHLSVQIENAEPNPSGEVSENDRRTERGALEKIARRMLTLLNVGTNQLIFETVTRSITVKARTRGTTLEAAGQNILARAALVAAENPPDNWLEWFEDVRYDYVPQGDERLNDRRLEARPVCGGERCTDGWEVVRVGDTSVLRRCPDCAQLWRDLGV